MITPYLAPLGPGPMPDAAAPGLAGLVAYDLAGQLWSGMGYSCLWAGFALGVLFALALAVAALAVVVALRK